MIKRLIHNMGKMGDPPGKLKGGRMPAKKRTAKRTIRWRVLKKIQWRYSLTMMIVSLKERVKNPRKLVKSKSPQANGTMSMTWMIPRTMTP